MNLSEKQQAPVLKNHVKKANEISTDWLETLSKQHLTLQAPTQKTDRLTGCLLPRWSFLQESDPDENDHFIKGYN